MRYALIFAGVAAAYDAYGYEASSSAPAPTHTSSVPAYGGYGEDTRPLPAPRSATRPSTLDTASSP